MSSRKLVGDKSSGTVSRALKMLTFIADAGGNVTVKQVAEEMGLAPSTVHRLLNLLRSEDYVEAKGKAGTYSIGPQFYRVAARVVSLVPLAELAQPVLDEIVHKYDETVVFGIYLPAERAMSFAARSDGKQKLTYRMDMNRPLSLVWGASGKAILAFLSDETVTDILRTEGLSPGNGAEPPSLETLHEQLTDIRLHGYAVSNGEKLPGAKGIAAPVFGASGVIGSLCLTSPEGRLADADMRQIAESIAGHAHTLSCLMGAPTNE